MSARGLPRGGREQERVALLDGVSVGFGKCPRQEASRTDAVPVALMNGEQLVNLLLEHQIGVELASHDLVQLPEAGDVETA